MLCFTIFALLSPYFGTQNKWRVIKINGKKSWEERYLIELSLQLRNRLQAPYWGLDFMNGHEMQTTMWSNFSSICLSAILPPLVTFSPLPYTGSKERYPIFLGVGEYLLNIFSPMYQCWGLIPLVPDTVT